MTKFKVRDRTLGEGQRPYIIAEIAQAHDGSLGLAHAYIEAAAAAGADAVKFQTHFAVEESTRDEAWRVNFSYQDKNRFEYWQRMEFNEEQWQGLKRHADDLNIDFISTPFSSKAIRLLNRLDVPFWKVSSGDINNLPLLKELASTGKPIVLSSGMSPISEVDFAVNLLTEYAVPFAVLQCTTAYPCPSEKIGLNNISLFSNRYSCPVGLSDHSGNIFSCLAAVALEAAILEVHVVFDKKMFGPDVSSSLTFSQLEVLVEGSNEIHKMLMNPIDKDALAIEEMVELRSLFQKSIVLAHDLEAGTTLTLDHLRFKKPGIGLTPEKVDSVIGKRLKTSLPADHFLSIGDTEG